MHRPTWPHPQLAGALAAAFALALPWRAGADPGVTLSWDHVGSAAQQVATKSYAGPGGYDLYVSLTGQSTPVAAFEVIVEVRGGRGAAGCFQYPVPDVPAAWRFDDAGCAAGHACFEGGTLVGASAAAQAGRLYLGDIAYDATTARERLVFVEDDPVPLATPDPARTYQLLHAHFDHAGTCAGEGDTANVALVLAHWLDVNPGGTEFAWNIAGPSVIGWNAPAQPGTCAETPPVASLALAAPTARSAATYASGGPATQSSFPMCAAPVPAAASSWGRVKATYR